jgi:hypothetical protein
MPWEQYDSTKVDGLGLAMSGGLSLLFVSFYTLFWKLPTCMYIHTYIHTYEYIPIYNPWINKYVTKTVGCKTSHKYTKIQIYSVKYYKHFTKWYYKSFFFLPWHNSPPAVCHGLFIIEDSSSHSDTNTISRTLDEQSAWRRDLYLITHNIHKTQTSMPPAGFEPTIPAIEWPQTSALDRAATGIGTDHLYT